jgi:Tfp pilus assembly protein FimT
MSGAPIRVPRFFSRRSASRGWSLVELAMIITIAAVLVTILVLQFRPWDMQSYQQAEGLRNDLRHMQMVAITWGQPLRLTTAAGSYSVACVTAGAVPCNVSPVLDPATAKSFSVTL